MVSGTLSLLCKRCFSPFPHGTGSLSVSGECLALADGPAGFTQGYTCPALLRVTARRTETSGTGLSPSVDRLSRLFPSNPSHHDAGPTTPNPPRRARFGLCPVRSPLLGVSRLFSLPPGTKMFQFPGFASTHQSGCTASGRAGCPIRKSADRRSLAPTRGLSQLATSFIAFRSLGIRHAPFLSFAAVIAGIVRRTALTSTAARLAAAAISYFVTCGLLVTMFRSTLGTPTISRSARFSLLFQHVK